MRTRRRQSLIICSICHTLVMFTFFFRCFSIAVDCDAALRDCVVLLNAHKSRLTHLISSEKCMRLLPGRTQRFRVRVERISHTITNSPELRWVYSSFCWACNVTRDECVCVCLCKIFHKSCRLNDFIDGIQSCLFDSKHSLTRTNARHTKKY